MAAITAAVCVAGMFKKEDVWKTPEELLVEYMNHIPAQEYEQMYAMLHIEASGNVSQEDFIKRNSAIYESIEIQNMGVEIIAYDEEQLTVTYQTSFDTVAGEISFENEAFFLEGEDGYKLVCSFYSRRNSGTSYIDYQYGGRCKRKRRQRICC